MNKKYELIVILDAALPQDKKDDVIRQVGEAIEKNEGKVINSQVWIDKQKMSFEMKKRPEGTYYLVNFEAPKAKISDLRRALKLNDQVLRSLVVDPAAA
ncbi:MAG: 30S ribosomal protein S6 [Candidatus Omnitrophota bacterium]